MEAAMEALREKYEFRVCWRPFLLRSNIPTEGIQKAPPEPGNPRVGERLKNAGAEVGIDFTGKCDRYPNTLAAHALQEYVLEKYGHQKQNELAEVIFKGYFTDGIYPDAKNLAAMANSVGLNRDEAKKVASDPEKIEQAHSSIREWTKKGCTGVPLFYMNGERTFSGARDTDSFIKMFELIGENHPVSG